MAFRRKETKRKVSKKSKSIESENEKHINMLRFTHASKLSTFLLQNKDGNIQNSNTLPLHAEKVNIV